MIPLVILNMFKKKPGKENDVKPILIPELSEADKTLAEEASKEFLLHLSNLDP
jgi:hypothetical protein